MANTPKRSGVGARMLVDDNDEGYYGQRGDEYVSGEDGLDYDFIKIRGEIGKRVPTAPYLSLYAGIDYSVECIRTLEETIIRKLGVVEGTVNQAVTAASAAVGKADDVVRAWNQNRMQGATDMSTLTGEVGTLKTALQAMGRMVTESQEGMLLLDGLVGAPNPAPSHVATSGVPMEVFLKFKADVAHDHATIRQDMKGGGIEMGTTVFGNSEDCVKWARVHLPRAYVYQVIPSLT